MRGVATLRYHRLGTVIATPHGCKAAAARIWIKGIGQIYPAKHFYAHGVRLLVHVCICVRPWLCYVDPGSPLLTPTLRIASQNKHSL